MSIATLVAVLAILAPSVQDPAPEPEAVLVGHIVDAEGNLLIEGWTVTASQQWGVVNNGRSVSARSSPDPSTGHFRLEGLPPGTLRVDASRGSVRIESVWVKTKQGEETHVELRYDGPDPGQRIVVVVHTGPHYAFLPDPVVMHAIASDGTRYPLTRTRDRASDRHFVDLARGTYRVEVRDPRFVDWTAEAVRTGETVRVNLVGNAAVRLAVIDAETGAAVDDYDLDVVYDRTTSRPSVHRVRERATPLPVGGVYAGVLSGDLTVEVRAEGWPRASATVDALAPREIREVTVSLTRGVPLRGRVVDSGGKALAGVPVQVTRGEHPGHDRAGAGVSVSTGSSGETHYSARFGYRDDATTTADDGSFAFHGLGSGTHALLALRGPWNDTATTVELPCTEPVVLTLPEAALTTVRVQLPDGESFEGLALQLGTSTGQQADALRMARAWIARDTWMCDSEGVFAARHLPVGAATLELVRATDESRGRRYEQIQRHDVILTHAGEHELELDLRESFPVPVTLRAAAPELVPDQQWTLHLDLVAEGAQRAMQVNTVRLSDLGNDAQVRWAAPGRYRLTASAPGIQWSRPELVSIVRGAANVFELDVPLVGRELRVLGADGAPLAETDVVYWTDSARRAFGRTDANGALVVVLLEGTLSLALLPPTAPDDEAEQGHQPRRSRGPTRVDPAVLAGLAARATAAFGAGEGPLELRLRPE